MPFTSALGVDALMPAGLGFRNKIINGDFRINQRGFTSNTTSQTFGFDRWYHEFSGGTCTYTPQSFTVGSPILKGYEASQFARLVNSGQSAASHYYLLGQKIEDVRNGDGVTLTVSFYAKAGSGTPSVAVELEQNFGSGGSARVLTYVGRTVISTSWARYSFTVTMPSITGKTIGSSSFLLLNIWVSAGSDYASRTGSLGIQNGTFDFWGVQVEANNVATSFEQRPIAIELSLCQRYFERLNSDPSNRFMIGSGGWDGASTFSLTWVYKTLKRARPTVTSSTAGIELLYHAVAWYTPTSVSYFEIGTHAVRVNYASSGSAVGGQAGVATFTTSSSGFIQADAEL